MTIQPGFGYELMDILDVSHTEARDRDLDRIVEFEVTRNGRLRVTEDCHGVCSVDLTTSETYRLISWLVGALDVMEAQEES